MLASIQSNFAPEELEILGFNNDAGDSKAEMQRYAEAFQPPFRILYDRTEEDIAEFKALQDQLLDVIEHRGVEERPSDLTPGYILTDADGNVIAVDAGVPTYSRIRKYLSAWEGSSGY